MNISRVKELIMQGDSLFSKRQSLMSLWQEIGDHFYPERANFTYTRSMGEEFAGHLSTSFPIIVRRDLANSFSTMLRPTQQDWFEVTTSRPELVDQAGKRWLEWVSGVQRRAMYDKRSLFVRATKEGDNDFCTFGQTCISVELNRDRDGLLYRCWHLRDVAWAESSEGIIDTVHRKWKPTARELAQYRNFDIHSQVTQDLSTKPMKEIDCRHIVMPVEAYVEGNSEKREKFGNFLYVSLYVDIQNQHIMEETGLNHMMYVIPRWQTVSGSQYAYSPCTVAGLPDARLIQSMTLTLLEAGEKAVNPPMIAQSDVVKSNVDIYAGGMTWVDAEYDERFGDALRPIQQDYSGVPFGMDMREDIKNTIVEAFYLNKLNLPPSDGEMTAYETGHRIQEYIRNALPLFEPVEQDYNFQICDLSFRILMDNGAYGAFLDMPQSLRGAEVDFKFESPIHEAKDQQKGHTFMQAKEMLAQAAELDQSSIHLLDPKVALRESLEGIKTPDTWIRGEQEVMQMAAQDAQKRQQAEQLAMMQQGGDAAQKIASASKDAAAVQQ